jgi:beta-glucanase (GH16 family)
MAGYPCRIKPEQLETHLKHRIALALCLALPLVAAAESATPDTVVGKLTKGGKPAGYQLVWHDEFDKDGLPDPAKWDYDTSMNKHGWANEELQYYAKARPENSHIENGKLLITARHEKLEREADFGGQAYSSARLYTRGKFEFTYGFVEVRAKLPCGVGTWPAIWMLGTQGDWPEEGEIDIMEHVGRSKGEVLGSLHTGAYNWPNNTQITAKRILPDVCDVFHNYQLTWDADHMMIGVDNQNYMRFTRPKNANHHQWPYDDPQYLILNLAIGGMLGGPVDDASLPQTMEVDYVRIYQKPGKH